MAQRSHGRDFDTPGQSESASLVEGERAPLLAPDDLERGGSVQYRYGTPTEGLRERGKATLLQQAVNVKSSYLGGHQREPTSTWGVFKMRSKYYVPALDWLPNYSFSLFWGDFAAGLTVASLVIPMSMSYASGLARLDPLAGLISAAVPGLIYALFGSSRQLSVGPEAALSLLVGQAVTQVLHGDPLPKFPFCGTCCINDDHFPRLLRLGFIDVVLSRALLRGFVTAVAVCRAVKRRLAKREGWRWVKFIPEVFLAVVIATALCDKFDWDLQGVDILGSASIKKGAKLFDFPVKHANLKFLKATTSTAVLISVVGYLDSVVAAKQNAARFGYSISPNRELVALGAGNLVSSFFPGTLPAYGAITRSRLNADIGGRTQMASILNSCFVILAVFFLLPALYYLPRCVLASIVCLVVYGLLAEAPEDVGFYIKMRSWVDLALMFVTFAFTLFWSVEVGVVVSVTVSLLLVVHKSSKAHIKILGRVPGTDRWSAIDEDPDAIEDVPGLLIVRIRESLDFANTGQLKERLRRLELYGPTKAHPSEAPRRNNASVVVFHMSDVETIDASAVHIFKELVEQYRERGVRTFFAHLRQEQREKFEKAEIIEIVGEEHITETVADAMAVIERENNSS
ncbi:sulfate anion transporter [Rhizoctonia solani]|uniref:Sulfate anion transporter n=1 Tax=Rhizoctonia solani TaxID=456999 RepID=A0A8H8P6A8_9AGAM|nr:sulfate anion transporter [Rhizoctonia solani]QRW25335.1 sulfate anion transporter [Rhizoctonia solani]